MNAPPNTRMQRTRSSPSALRSPLMRWPLGRSESIAVALTTVVFRGFFGSSQRRPRRMQLAEQCHAHPQNTGPQVTLAAPDSQG